MSADKEKTVPTLWVESMLDYIVERAALRMAEIVTESKKGPPALLDTAGVAKALDVSPPTVRRMVDRGLPSVRCGDCRRYVLADVLDWLRRNEGQ